MFCVAQIIIDQQPKIVWFPEIRNIGALFTNQCADTAKNPRVVGNRRVKGHRIDGTMRAFLPMQVNPAFGLFFLIRQCLAIDRIDHHPLTSERDAQDARTRDRLTT